MSLLEKKKQIILYGPPGTGKTYNTREISVKLLIGEYGKNSATTDNEKKPINSNKAGWPTVEMLYEKVGVEHENTARKIVEWSDNKGFDVRPSEKTINFDYNLNDKRYKLFKIYVLASDCAPGTMELCFEYLKKVSPFDDYSKRLDLLNQFNKVPVFKLVEEDVNKRPGLLKNVSTQHLKKESDLDAFFEAIEWFLEQVKNTEKHSNRAGMSSNNEKNNNNGKKESSNF